MVTGKEEFYAPTWSDWTSYGPTLLVGILLFGLIHVPRFRGACWELLKLAGQTLRLVFFDSFRWFFGLPLVQRVLRQSGHPVPLPLRRQAAGADARRLASSAAAVWPVGR